MRHRARHKLRQRVPIPKLSELDSWDIARYLATRYCKCTTRRCKRDVIETLLVLAPNFDAITRSICYYNLFEEWVDESFSVFWGKVPYNSVVDWLNSWEKRQ